MFDKNQNRVDEFKIADTVSGHGRRRSGTNELSDQFRTM